MKVKALVLASALALSCSAHAVDFGLPKLGASASAGNVDADIKSFLQTSDEAHALTTRSATALGNALLTKEKMQANSDALDAANKIADPKERDIAVAKVQADLQAELAKVDYQSQAAALAKENDSKKNALVGASMYNFVLGLLKDKELVGRGQSLVSGAASNPAAITKMGKVKDVVASLSGQMDNMGKIAVGLQKMSGVIKSKPLPTSAASAPVSVAD